MKYKTFLSALCKEFSKSDPGQYFAEEYGKSQTNEEDRNRKTGSLNELVLLVQALFSFMGCL